MKKEKKMNVGVFFSFFLLDLCGALIYIKNLLLVFFLIYDRKLVV